MRAIRPNRRWTDVSVEPWPPRTMKDYLEELLPVMLIVVGLLLFTGSAWLG